jgi:hypothetical protein
MSRFIVTVTAALTFASGLAIAQETRTKTEVKGGRAQTITYTGCVQTGSEARTYILDQAVPVSRTTTTTEQVGTSGAVVNTVTRYALVPSEKVELVEHVGHKVEVTGMVVPAGQSESRTKTKIEREHGKDTKITEKTKSDNDLPQFRVTSVKHLAESCQ